MSTNATVSIVNKDGTVHSIYNHWDGYPSYLGRILKTYYKSENRVRDLIGMGDASVIARKINPKLDAPHDFNTRQKGVCLFYSRDRGEEDTEMHVFDSFENMLKKFGQQYNYVYQNKRWYCCSEYTDTSLTMKSVEEAIEEDE